MKLKTILKIFNASIFVIISLDIALNTLIQKIQNKSYFVFELIFIITLFIFLLVNIILILPMKKEKKRELIEIKKEFLFELNSYKDLNPIGIAMYDIYSNKNEDINNLINKYNLKLKHLKINNKKIVELSGYLTRKQKLYIRLIYDNGFQITINDTFVDKSFNSSEEVVEFIIDVFNKYDSYLLKLKNRKDESKYIEVKISFVAGILLSLSWVIFIGFIAIGCLMFLALFIFILLSGESSFFGMFVLLGLIYSLYPLIASICVNFISLIISLIRKNRTGINISTLLLIISIIQMAVSVLFIIRFTDYYYV